MPEKTVGIREFARLVGRSHTWVLGLTRRGIIPVDDGGKIPVKEAVSIVKEYNETPAVKRRNGGEAANVGSYTENPKRETLLSFDEARAKKETYLAEIKEMEARIMRGEYVSVESVKADARAVAEKVRAFCIAAPSRYAGLLENRTQREAEAVLQDLFSEFLTRINGGEFLSEGDAEDVDEDDMARGV